MTPDEKLDRLVERHGVFLSTAYSMPNPRDDPERWRRRWAQLMAVAGEVSRLAGMPGPTPG